MASDWDTVDVIPDADGDHIAVHVMNGLVAVAIPGGGDRILDTEAYTRFVGAVREAGRRATGKPPS